MSRGPRVRSRDSRTVARGLLTFLLLIASSRGDAAETTVLALIVTNNRSPQAAHPDLRYADDDGAKYDELFRTLTADDNVVLLTELDADTARLFPGLRERTQPPDRAHVNLAAARLAARAAAARSQGRDVDFYFIFAGHGDIDRGRGVLDLLDGPFTADDLVQLLHRVPAARSHVILDSCDSFFVINPRKPGGLRFATPADATARVSERLSNVGVFLSTSAEGQAYEWSELQSGIFSHAVRSGLAGAADANHDGRISYEELEAFVVTAVAEVRNPLYRPGVFARGPSGHNDAALLDWTTSRAARLDIPAGAAQRLTLRDADELAWIDLHSEAGAALTLRLPAHLADGLTVEARHGAEPSERRAQRVAAGTSAALADMPMATDLPAGRGPQELFRMLFNRPFGPHVFASWHAALVTPRGPGRPWWKRGVVWGAVAGALAAGAGIGVGIALGVRREPLPTIGPVRF